VARNSVQPGHVGTLQLPKATAVKVIVRLSLVLLVLMTMTKVPRLQLLNLHRGLVKLQLLRRSVKLLIPRHPRLEPNSIMEVTVVEVTEVEVTEDGEALVALLAASITGEVEVVVGRR